MAADAEIVQSGTAPEVLEFGRYRMFETPDGGWVLARASGTCDRCQECGCGDQADPIHIPAMMVAMAKQGGGLGRAKAALRGVMGRGPAQG
jgi:hypothetical protein